MRLPKFFIGSSKEALDAGLVEALRAALDAGLNSRIPSVEIVLWPNSPWANLESALGSLVENLADYSYAAFILSADDVYEIRGTPMGVARDNVIFEFGLFLAYLGKGRTFFIGPSDIRQTILAKDIKTASAPVAPPPHVALRILSDVGSIYRMGDYTTSNPGPSPHISFRVDEIVATIREREVRISGLAPSDAEVELKRRMLEAEARIVSSNRCDAFYSSQFFSEFRDLALLKARASGKSVQNVVKDLLLHIERIGDICDVRQLAEEQHHSKEISEVWVFSDDPLEFRPGPPDEGQKRLRETIIDNLKHNVKYTYFVGPRFNMSWIEQLVNPGHPDERRILENLNVVIIQPQAFFTFFTVHFDGPRTRNPRTRNPRKLKAIYMSTVMKNQADLLIQVSGEHARRVYDRISVLLGEDDSPRAPHIKRYVLG